MCTNSAVVLLTSTTTVPIYGKLADLFGRKPVFLFGTAVFLIGSIASGAAQSMEQLIIFRAIQGLGAGAVLPIVLTIIGDIFTLEERARVPFKENIERKKLSLDYIGTFTLTGGIVALLFALLQGGTSWAWNSLQSIALFALAAALLVLFFYQERRSPEPILPLTLFKSRIIAISSIGGVILGVLMFGITSYAPLFVQGVKGGTATSAGITLGPLLIAWPISSTLSGKVILRFGYRFTAVLGASLATLGMGMVMFFHMDTGFPFIIAAMAVLGTGLGFMSTSFVLAVQNVVPWNLRGVATASTQFFRTISGTIGVAIMGTILNAQMALHFAPIFARYPDVLARLPKGIAPSNVLLTPEVRSTLPLDLLRQLQVALAQSLFWVFALMFVCACIGLASMFLLPGGKAEQYSYHAQVGAPAQKDAASETHEPQSVALFD